MSFGSPEDLDFLCRTAKKNDGNERDEGCFRPPFTLIAVRVPPNPHLYRSLRGIIASYSDGVLSSFRPSAVNSVCGKFNPRLMLDPVMRVTEPPGPEISRSAGSESPPSSSIRVILTRRTTLPELSYFSI